MPSMVVIALSVAGRGEREAGVDRHAVDEDGAGAALAAAADELRPGEMEPLAQRRQQRLVGRARSRHGWLR